MSDEVIAPRETTFFGARAAICLAGAFLVALLVIVALGMASRANVKALEQFEDVSAVGDTAFFQRPDALSKPPAPVAHLDSRPLYLLGIEKIEIRDTKMERVGRDAEIGVTIYRTREPIDGKKQSPREFFLKIGRDDYVKVRADRPEK